MNAHVDLRQDSLSGFDRDGSLIVAIGNDGRQDDGLGWALMDWLESNEICPKTELVRRYQLLLDDADLIKDKSRVLFVDATKAADVSDIGLETVHPRMDDSFTSHAVSIPTIMATCERCFNTVPQVHLLTIKGYKWELKFGLTENASKNLQKAKNFLSQAIGD